MSKRRFKPPLNKTFVGTQQDYSIYTVNAAAIRNAAQPDEEFDNIAIHSDFPDLIGDDEIWTAESTFKREGQFFIANAIAELDALNAGKSKTDAYEAGLEAEQKLREQQTGIKFRDGKPHRHVPDELYRRRYCLLPDKDGAVEIWLVDGCLVRCYYKTDYTEGGHHLVYPWVPEKELWVESNLMAEEIPYIVAHEYTERRIMRDDEIDYDRAHEIAAEMEFDLRKAAARAEFPGLSRRRLKREDLPKLASRDFAEYVEREYVHNLVRRTRALVSDAVSKVFG